MHEAILRRVKDEILIKKTTKNAFVTMVDIFYGKDNSGQAELLKKFPELLTLLRNIKLTF